MIFVDGLRVRFRGFGSGTFSGWGFRVYGFKHLGRIQDVVVRSGCAISVAAGTMECLDLSLDPVVRKS